jgi:hypothetical protein
MAKSIELHPHAYERAVERGVTEAEIVATIAEGERLPAKFGRSAFRRNFSFNAQWRGKTYGTKQVEAIAVDQNRRWLVITVLARYF